MIKKNHMLGSGGERKAALIEKALNELSEHKQDVTSGGSVHLSAD